MKYKQIKNFALLLGLLLIILGYNACVKDNFNYNKLTTNDIVWRPNLATPVAFAYLNLRDLVQDYDSTELFIEDQTGLLFLMYESRIASVNAANLINIPNQNFTENIPIPNLSSIGNSFSTTVNNVQDFVVNNNERIDSLIFKSCDLSISVTSAYNQNGYVKITFPSIKRNGQTYIINVPFNATSNTTKDDTLGTYHISLTSGVPSYNKLPYTIELSINNSSAPINNTDNLSVNFDFSNIQFGAAFGFLGKNNLSVPLDTVILDMFDNVLAGLVTAEDPKLNIYIHNSFGMEVQVMINNLTALSQITNSTYNLTLPSFYTPLLVSGPGLNQVGQSVTSTISIDKTNSNIQNVMSYFPYYIFYSADAQTNPNSDMNPNLQSNFVLDTSRIDIDMEVIMPLWGRAKYLILQDTVSMDVSSFFNDLRPIDWVLFRTNITNGFPTEVGVQGYFTDSLYNVVDSLFERETEFISSGILNSDGKVIQPVLRTTDILFPRNRIRKLENVKYVLFRGYASTTNSAQETVKIYSSYGIDVQMALQAQFSINQAYADTTF